MKNQWFPSRDKNNEAIESFLNDLSLPKLSEEQKMSCESKITWDNCALLLECFQNNKTPGNDGIPFTFYKKFWPLISEPFIQCIKLMNASKKAKYISCSQKQAVKKKGNDRSSFDNWRPLSLVKVDAKIMSKATATRMKMSCRMLSITIKLAL